MDYKKNLDVVVIPANTWVIVNNDKLMLTSDECKTTSNGTILHLESGDINYICACCCATDNNNSAHLIWQKNYINVLNDDLVITHINPSDLELKNLGLKKWDYINNDAIKQNKGGFFKWLRFYFGS